MSYDLADGIKWYLAFLFSTSVHEAAHAWSAYRLGDDTAHRGGQVTLNPVPHIKREPFGMVVVPLLSFFLGGWMVGWASAPYDRQWAIQYPRRAALMALAGPASNVILVLLAAALMRLGYEWGFFHRAAQATSIELVLANGNPEGIWTFCAKMVSVFFSLNLLLAAFNLLPVPPMDGSSLPFFFLGERAAEAYRAALMHPALLWGGLFVAWKVFGLIYPSIFQFAVKLLYFFIPAGY